MASRSVTPGHLSSTSSGPFEPRVDGLERDSLSVPSPSSAHRSPQATPSTSSPSASSGGGAELERDVSTLHSLPEADVLDMPETKERRLTELQLLHNYVVNLAQPFKWPQSESVLSLWTHDVPQMALRWDVILYCLLAQSALNMWSQAAGEAERERLINLQRRYLGLALREQRGLIAELGLDNADAICISSLLILTHAFARVQTAPTDGWAPPLEWMRMGRGAGAVFTVAKNFLMQKSDAKVIKFFKSPPVLDDEAVLLAPENREGLVWLIEQDFEYEPSARELEDRITRDIYYKTLSYVGSVEKAIKAAEPEFAITRRMAAFSVWAPTSFPDFLQQKRPRAMVVLAYFFSLWKGYESMWMIGKTGTRQVKAIYNALPAEWRHKLDTFRDGDDAMNEDEG